MDKWCGLRVKGKKCPIAIHTYSRTSFMLKKPFPLLWCRCHNTSEKSQNMMERGWELFHRRSHNLTVSYCSSHGHSSCQRQKHNRWTSTFLCWVKLMLTTSHIRVWNTKFTEYPFTCVCLCICMHIHVFKITNLHCTGRKQSVHLKHFQTQNGIAVWSVSTL